MSNISENKNNEFFNNRLPLNMSFYSDNYNNIRRSKAIIIMCCLRTHKVFKEMPEERQMDIVKRIERSCYNNTCEIIGQQGLAMNWMNAMFVKLYDITCYKIQTNLELSEIDDFSTILVHNICNNVIDPRKLAFMSSHELQPGRANNLHKVIEERKQQKIKKKISTQHKCRICGNRKTTEQEVQARSLDEGSTLIITCETEGCCNKWTITS